MSKYSNLPGIDVNIADGGLILPEDTRTESLLIIGKAGRPDAPKEPVLVRQSAELEALGFGSFVEDGKVNEIAAAWKAAHEAGNHRIYLMSMGKLEEGEIKDVDPNTLTTGEKFQFVQDALNGPLTDFSINHIVLTGAYANEKAEIDGLTLEYTSGVENEFQTEASVELNVVADTNDKVIINNDTLTLEVGEYQSVDEWIVELQSEIKKARLEGFTVSKVGEKVRISHGAQFTIGAGSTAIGAEAEVTSKSRGNFASLIAHYAEQQTLSNNSTIAYIGVVPPKSNSLRGVKTHVDELVSTHNQYSGYVQVVAAPELGYRIPGRSETHYMNGVVTYAATVSTLRPESAPTNKTIAGISGIRYNLSQRQLNELTGAKYVTFRLRGAQVIVTDGITTAPDRVLGGMIQESDYARLSTLRITQATTQMVRDLCEPFIGEPNRMPQYNALNATVKGGLEAMKAQGVIFDYRYTVVAKSGSLSEAVITLEIVPALEMRRITIDVSLRPQYLF